MDQTPPPAHVEPDSTSDATSADASGARASPDKLAAPDVDANVDPDVGHDEPDGALHDLTPAERRKRRVREQIIEAAESVFAAEGPAGLSMRRLAERIDYSPAAIYKYFASKRELIEAIRETFFARLLERISGAVDEADFINCVRRCSRAYIECGLERPNHYRMAFASAVDEQGLAEETNKVSEGDKAFEAALHLEGMIETGVRLGLFQPVDPTLAAKSVWAALHGVTILMVEMDDFPKGIEGSEHLTRDALIDFHSAMITRGLSVAPQA